MKYYEILDRLDDEARESLLESILMAYCKPQYGSLETFGRQVSDAIGEAILTADEGELDAATLAAEDERSSAIERSVQINAMNRRAA